MNLLSKMDAQVKCFFRLDERKKKSVVSVCKSDVKTHQNSHQNSFFFFFFKGGIFLFKSQIIFFTPARTEDKTPDATTRKKARSLCFWIIHHLSPHLFNSSTRRPFPFTNRAANVVVFFFFFFFFFFIRGDDVVAPYSQAKRDDDDVVFV